MADAHAIVDEEVRELVRRRGIDPTVERQVIADLVDEVVADYLDRAATSSLPRLSDADCVTRLVVDAVAGFGPLQPLLDDPGVEEVWINEPGRVFAARDGRPELTNVILTGSQVAELIDRMLRPSGRRIDLSMPFVDASLPDGSRLHVVIAPITREHPAVNIRKFALRLDSLDELAAGGSLTNAAARFLEASVAAGLNVLVSGGTQAGKTTLLGALCNALPARERVVTVEEVFELRLRSPDVVSLQTRPPSLEGTGEVTLRRLVKEALRMRPSRLIVGEVRQDECLDLLIALNSGVPGMCTLHANSAREALLKMCTLPLLAGENVSAAFVVPTVAASVDIVVQMTACADGSRRVDEIVGVTGRIERDVIETSEIFASQGGHLARGSGYPPRADDYAAAGLELARVLASEPAGGAG